MKRVLVVGTILLLAGCSINRQAEVSSLDAPNGIVRLNYGQAMLQNAHSDAYVNNGTAEKACQSMGYATASAYGQPIKTCTLISGSLCLNETMTIQYKCMGYAVTPNANNP
ncbi:YecR family lipoprotein [Enterobacter wuhouensis]|uniref:YecR family lipoprotein n=2 Tax=Enterobacter wuhouensis TaxID=2529381 RepID=A0ABZ1DBI4_9ENTR|nr:YecR family lipoprotein [Enterobacter wuhouensis]WRW29919.1 YecR family lipoprotein [Enterobacter wuhouensis]